MRADIIFKEICSNKALEIVMYVMQHTNMRTGIFNRTYNQIQKDTGISQVTIAKAFKAMEDYGGIKYLGKSCWRNNAIVEISDSAEGIDPYVEIKEP